MKQIHFNLLSGLTSLMLVIYVQMINHDVKVMESKIQILSANNLQLIGVNEALSKGVSDVAESMIQKATWDKQVAEKIQELDALVKGVYGKTN